METHSEQEAWKNTLKSAEVNPSPSVWEGVELHLNKAEVVHLKRTVVYYKWMAAACVTLAVLAVGFNYINNSSSIQEKSSLTLIQATSETPQHREETYTGVTKTSTGESQMNQYPDELKRTTVPVTLFTVKPYTEMANALLPTLTSREHTFSFNRNNGLIRAARENTEDLVKSPLLKDVEVSEPLALVKNEKEVLPSKKEEERFWTSIGFAAGTFNNTTPTNGGSTATTLRSASAGQTAASESNSPGYSYSVNLSVGTKLSKRWLLQGGMSYISQLSDYTATSVVSNQNNGVQTFSAASINQFEKQAQSVQSESSILASTPYTVNNAIQMISLPIQAGYVVMDRKLAFQVNSGISTDLFLENTITPQVENLEKTTQGRGDDSPYRPVNFSGLIGTELSYRFGENYRIALSPGLRYPFSSIYKTDLGIKSSPLTFDVAVRFRYILK